MTKTNMVLSTKHGKPASPEERDYTSYHSEEYVVYSSEAAEENFHSGSTYAIISRPAEEVSFYYSSSAEARKRKNLQLNGVNATGIHKIKASLLTE